MQMKRKIAVWILVVAVLQPGALRAQVATLPNANAAAAAANAVIDTPAIPVQIVVGRSTVLDIGTPITRVSLTNADVADAMVTSTSQLLLHGKTPGTISMFVWERAGGVRRYDVSVGRDVARLAEQVKQLFPNENIQVTSNGRDVVFSGSVTTKEMAEKVSALGTSFVERKEDVVNLLQVQARPNNQVLLKVRFAEVSRSALTELGISLFTSPTGINNTIGRVTTQQFAAPGYDELNATKVGEDPFKFGAPVDSASGKYTFSDFLIPVAQAGGGNAITVEFKEFGVRLNFTPTVEGDRIRLKVRPEVSTLDFANGIQLQGFRIPALISRRTSTELELRNGQTFAIAGLLNNSMTSTMTKIPGIGDIPILGYLFRSKAAQKNRTELVVMITPVLLNDGSSGVTRELPRLSEPFLPALRDNEAIAPPPAAFPQSNLAAPPAGLAGLDTPTTSAQAVPSPIVVDSGTPQLTTSERRVAERAQKADAERAAAEARAQARAEAEEQKREAEEQKREAEEQKREAEEQKREERLAKEQDRKSTRLNSSHSQISYAV